MKILHNHLGYNIGVRKRALVRHNQALLNTQFSVVNNDTREVVFQGELVPCGNVPEWRDWLFWEADFSSVETPGNYFLLLNDAFPPVVSAVFPIAEKVYDGQIISDLVHYLKSQRCGGKFDAADHARPKLGTQETVDVHGGWYDASGDASKYLSHLSYANFMNPQQTPQVVWNLLDGFSRMAKPSVWLEDKIIDEALHGADFLMRMLDKDGYFYMTVFDRWSKDVNQRDICSYTTQQGHKFDTFQSGFRQGAGSAIAALARASGLERDGAFTRDGYLAAAEIAFQHLEQNNLRYLDNGKENIIDDYCALLAASELFHATTDPRYGEAAEERVKAILQKQNHAGWYWADDEKTRSYFHAAEAGLLYIALMRFAQVHPKSKQATAALNSVGKGLRHDLRISFADGSNPFGYPRQHIRMPDQVARNQFFIPHYNESGYWWQGENARLGSLASAASMYLNMVKQEPSMHSYLSCYARCALDWIFGFNPFDACMLQGHGHNNPRYEAGFWNAPGGVCNGITSGLKDESDIDFLMPRETEPIHSWRWSEQWIPHGAWLFHALSHQV